MKTALYIGRFQPFHIGHRSVLEEIKMKGYDLIVGIGSSQYHHTKDNPFTFEERETMIKKSFPGNYEIKPIPDIHNYAEWADHVTKSVSDFDIIYSGNEIVKELMQKKGKEVAKVNTIYYISATEIRNMIKEDADWKKYVPQGTIDTIIECDGVKRIKNLYTEYKNPFPTVDTIIRKDNGIVYIKRKNEPIGWALPGGYIDYGESAEFAAVRESKEETGLEVKLIDQLHAYSDPERDPRKHTITIVFIGDAIGGTLKAGDDADQAIITPLNERPSLVLGHGLFIEDYKKWKNQNEI